ncbi:hypothetical protein ALC62_14727 [Cyphomyrmex costatus]|uniref:Uncharacterized protein n=1 Tax=Cyphomyrmex costatus TaxID=456900 RepID=A0A151I8Z6_9HYME|nr:hypothetical protein ALC62_14727 [Cyphomyrmex costatus]
MTLNKEFYIEKVGGLLKRLRCNERTLLRGYGLPKVHKPRGRHANVDCFYLCQTYAKIPKHLIRDNANLLILFKQDGTNLKRVYNDHVNTDMLYEDFCDLCRKCWQQKYGFLVIDKDSALANGRYRKGFNDFAVP